MDIDPQLVYNKGLDDLASLRGTERLIFMLQDFDNLMEMEGWDHYFFHENHFAWYPEMKEWLRKIGDAWSLGVLNAFEEHLEAHGVELSPSAIGKFVDSQDDELLQNEPDWRGRYLQLKEQRFNKAIAYLNTQGVHLIL